MFKASLFLIMPNWKLAKCPSVGEWITKLWYIHTREDYLVRSNESLKVQCLGCISEALC